MWDVREVMGRGWDVGRDDGGGVGMWDVMMVEGLGCGT